MDAVCFSVSATSFNISPFPANWTCYSASSVILDEKLCGKANGSVCVS